MDEEYESALDFEPQTKGQDPLFEEFSNPAGVSRGGCDTAEGEGDPSCDLEATAQIEDFAVEETKPGVGIAGYEGEEVGGA